MTLARCPDCGATGSTPVRGNRPIERETPQGWRVSCGCGCDGPLRSTELNAVLAWNAMPRREVAKS